MRFSCGLTKQGKIDALQKEWQTKLRTWHKAFALFPVQIVVENGEKKCAWLEYYEVRYPDWVMLRDWIIEDSYWASGGGAQRRFLTHTEQDSKKA